MLNSAKDLICRIKYRISWYFLRRDRRKVIHNIINGYNLLVLANEDVGRQIAFRQQYESLETEFLRSNIPANAVCIDIGANVGYFTMLMAQTASLGEVHSFEPLTLNVSLLRASAELNGFTNIRLNQSAVGNLTGRISFMQASDSAYSSICDTNRKSIERTINVPIIKLDDYLEAEKIYKVDIMKVDAEGAEGLVIDGALKLLNDGVRRPRIIMVELEDRHLEKFGYSINGIINTMNAHGYIAHFVNDKGLLQVFENASGNNDNNILFVQK